MASARHRDGHNARLERTFPQIDFNQLCVLNKSAQPARRECGRRIVTGRREHRRVAESWSCQVVSAVTKSMSNKSTTRYQFTSAAPDEAAAEVRIRCSDWRQARRLKRQALNGDAAVVRLASGEGAMEVALELPDGQVLSLRARMTGRMLDRDGELEAVIIGFDLDDGMRRQLERAQERAGFVHSDAERMQELARHEGATAPPSGAFGSAVEPPRDSGVQARSEDKSSAGGQEPQRASQRPTVPDALLEEK